MKIIIEEILRLIDRVDKIEKCLKTLIEYVNKNKISPLDKVDLLNILRHKKKIQELLPEIKF